MEPVTFKQLTHPVHFLALGFGSGCVPHAPGTMGTVVAIPLYLLIQPLAWPYQLALVGVLFAAGIWICGYTARALNVPDHPAIVWDEIVGYLVTMLWAPAGWAWMLLGFCAFRLFDIWKPWPIRGLDRRLKGGAGIMLDDLVAGIFSLTILQLIAYIIYT